MAVMKLWERFKRWYNADEATENAIFRVLTAMPKRDSLQQFGMFANDGEPDVVVFHNDVDNAPELSVPKKNK
jgi:hypothetical protein